MKRRISAAAAAFVLGQAAAVDAQPAQGGRVGFYQWLGVSDLPGDLLTQARRRTTALGSRVFRFYLGCRYDYEYPVMDMRRFGGAAALTPAGILAAFERYRAVADDPMIETVVVTVYSCADYGGGPDDINLQRPWGEREEKRVGEQIGALAEWLYARYGDKRKTVILANNETDEKLLDIANYTGSMELAAANLRAWLRARQAAVEAARRRHPNAAMQLFHAVEISLVNLQIVAEDGGFRKAARPGANALSLVVPEIEFDLVSYSAYESANSPYETQDPDNPPEETGGRLLRDLERIRAAAGGSLSAAGRARFGDRFVMVGELGYPRDRFEHLATGGVKPRLRAALGAALDWGCPYVVLWQAFDAPRSGGAAWGFGLYDRRGGAPALRAAPGSCSTLRDCMEALFESGFEGWRP